MLKVSHPQTHVALQYRGHVANKKRYSPLSQGYETQTCQGGALG